MKYAIATAVVVVLLSGCAVAHKTVLPDGRQGLSINCSGAAQTWNGCYEKAGEQCPHGYDVLGKDGDTVAGFGAGNGWAAGNASNTRSMLIACKA